MHVRMNKPYLPTIATTISLNASCLSCRSFHKNETIYNAFKLKNVVDIDQVKDYIKDFEIQQKISQFKNKIKVRTDKLELLTPDAKAKLKDLAESPLNDINFDKYAQLVST